MCVNNFYNYSDSEFLQSFNAKENKILFLFNTKNFEKLIETNFVKKLFKKFLVKFFGFIIRMRNLVEGDKEKFLYFFLKIFIFFLTFYSYSY